jgi:hypothetical protein
MLHRNINAALQKYKSSRQAVTLFFVSRTRVCGLALRIALNSPKFGR